MTRSEMDIQRTRYIIPDTEVIEAEEQYQILAESDLIAAPGFLDEDWTE